MKIKVAVTGGIGSGKTTVLAILKDFGYFVFSCDEIYKNLIHNKEYVVEIEKRFGCVKDGVIQLDKLSTLVFSNPEKRNELNALAHPRIMKELLQTMESAPSSIVFAEVPLLFEGEYEKLFDKVLVVLRDKSTRISSVKERDALSEEQVVSRINAQINYEADSFKERLQNIDAYTIQNTGDVTKLKKDIEKILKTIQS